MSFPNRFLADGLSSLSPSLLLIFGLPLLCILITRVLTTFRYRLSLSKHLSKRGSSEPLSPPEVPYNIPYLGHAFAFLSSRPGHFWDQLFRTHPRSVGAYTLLLGGEKHHILFDPASVQAMLKSRLVTRETKKRSGGTRLFAFTELDFRKIMGVATDPPRPGVFEETNDYLLRTDRVNELTAQFMKTLTESLAQGRAGNEDSLQTGIAVWLRDCMFRASTHALMGKRLLEIYPNLVQDFWAFDSALIPIAVGTPKFWARKHYDARDRAIDGMERWERTVWQACGGKPVDPDAPEVAWEPHWGSRYNRAHQKYYDEVDLGMRAKAGLDLGFLFAVSSNAIPAACWMLLHILDPRDKTSLLPRVLAELGTAKTKEGTVDVNTLVSLPLLQSILNEVLRLYTDVLITKDVKGDLTLPVGGKGGNRHLLLKKDDQVIAPTWVLQHEADLWDGPAPAGTFYAERFLRYDPGAGKDVFSMDGTSGKFFPFSAGKGVCPGRVFAKQEILGAVATVLLKFDVEALGFLDSKGRRTERFPGLANVHMGGALIPLDGDLEVRLRTKS